MKKFHILLIVLLGIFLVPTSTFACESHSVNKSCGMEMSSKTKKKDCCSKDSESKSNKQNGCNGKCGQGLCSSSSVNIGIASFEQFRIQDALFNFSNKKQSFHQKVSFTSAGYSSIWLIPKIS